MVRQTVSAPDFRVQNDGSSFLLHANTRAARNWVEEHIPRDAMTWHGDIVIAPGYISDIVKCCGRRSNGPTAMKGSPRTSETHGRHGYYRVTPITRRASCLSIVSASDLPPNWGDARAANQPAPFLSTGRVARSIRAA